MYDKEIRLFHKYEKFESDLEYAMSFGSLSKLEEKIKEMEERMKRKVVMHLDGYDGDPVDSETKLVMKFLAMMRISRGEITKYRK